MSDKYTLVHEGLSRWINSPNNGGECCQTYADTVDELNRLLAQIKRLDSELSIARKRENRLAGRCSALDNQISNMLGIIRRHNIKVSSQDIINVEYNAVSDTIRTDTLLIAHYMSPEPKVLINHARALERALNAADDRLSHITDGFRREQNDIEQTCGKALGYPRFCDDQKNFPGSTEADGVIIGDHVAASIAAELANKYAAAMERVKRLEEVGKLCLDFSFRGMHVMAERKWREATEAKP